MRCDSCTPTPALHAKLGDLESTGVRVKSPRGPHLLISSPRVTTTLLVCRIFVEVNSSIESAVYHGFAPRDDTAATCAHLWVSQAQVTCGSREECELARTLHALASSLPASILATTSNMAAYMCNEEMSKGKSAAL
jgi:hypothetical protein